METPSASLMRRPGTPLSASPSAKPSRASCYSSRDLNQFFCGTLNRFLCRWSPPYAAVGRRWELVDHLPCQLVRALPASGASHLFEKERDARIVGFHVQLVRPP